MNPTSKTGGAGVTNTRQFATFYVENLFFGLEVLEVQEVLRSQEMTRVPLAPGVIQGLINLRGQIVTAIDMRQRLHLRNRDSQVPPMNMVVRSEDGAVSLLVDEIGDVLEAPADAYELPPQNMQSEHRQMIEGVYKLEGKLLLVLDREKVLQVQGEN